MDAKVTEEKIIKQEVTNLIDENRIINFSDAVFAFAATLLVLKIDLPELQTVQMSSQFMAVFSTLWPQYLANIISFFVIEYYWLNHHAIFALLKRYTMTLVWMNIFFLILVSFIPFPVDLFGSYMNVAWVVVFYSASLAIVGYMLSLLWFYASYNNRLVDNTLSKKEIRYYLYRTLIAPVVFTLSIPLVAVHPMFTQVSWIFVLIGLLFINKFFKVKKLHKITSNAF